MDLHESEKQKPVNVARPPLFPGGKNMDAAVTTRHHHQTREISSRYRLSSQSTPMSLPRRCPSPNVTRTPTAMPQFGPKRAQSAERRQPAGPPITTTTIAAPFRHHTAPSSITTTTIATPLRHHAAPWITSTTIAIPSRHHSAVVSKPRNPNKTAAVSRDVTPARTRPLNHPFAAPVQYKTSTPAVTLGEDLKKLEKTSSRMEDAHQLKLLYNRCLQWRFAGAKAETVLHNQIATAERSLFAVWNTTKGLRDSLISKRVSLLLLKLEFKLNSIIINQMIYLRQWRSLQKDYTDSLSHCAAALEANTLHLPVTGMAKVNVESFKLAMSSAATVIQALKTSLHALFQKVAEMKGALTQLGAVAAQEKIMLHECKKLLTWTTRMQTKECSIRTQLMQKAQHA